MQRISLSRAGDAEDTRLGRYPCRFSSCMRPRNRIELCTRARCSLIDEAIEIYGGTQSSRRPYWQAAAQRHLATQLMIRIFGFETTNEHQSITGALKLVASRSHLHAAAPLYATERYHDQFARQRCHYLVIGLGVFHVYSVRRIIVKLNTSPYCGYSAVHHDCRGTMLVEALSPILTYTRCQATSALSREPRSPLDGRECLLLRL